MKRITIANAVHYNLIKTIALTGVAILFVIRCGECFWFRKGNK